ncbi:SAM domain-containing protein [Plasmodium vivax Brazil I]|uniref:SAM domain-containing protein n=1 Tax=Plasmodium vivax (strain Brazil I) TaxID=1033975 RepID=A0A0J9SQ82_PLAV1|nr:SAM domain-containing protein [Plasmodium vivax Brazil I]
MGNSPDSKPIRGRDFRGYRYIGELNDEREPNGKGLILHNSGEAFYGSFSNGKKNGIGIYINNKLTKYICNWVNDTVDGELKVKPFHAEKVFSFFYSNGVIHSCRVYRGGPKSERGLDEEQSRGTPKGGGEPQSVNIRNKLDGEGVSFIPVSQPGYFFPAGRIHHGRTAGPGSDHREDAIESSHDEANIPADELNKKRIDEPLKGDDTWKDIFYTSSDSCSHLIGAHFIKMGGKKKCHRDARLGGTTRKDLSIVTHTLAKKEERKTKHMIKRLTKQNSNSLRIDKYESWSRREVAQWLSLCNTPIKWITSFYRNNITGDMLDRMNIEIFRNQLGILPYGHAIKLLQLIKNLRVMAYNKRFARCVNIQECEHFLRRRKKKKKKIRTRCAPRGKKMHRFHPPPSEIQPIKQSKHIQQIQPIQPIQSIQPIQGKLPLGEPPTSRAPPEEEAAVLTEKMLRSGGALYQEEDPDSCTSTTSFNSTHTLKEEEVGEEGAQEGHHQKRHHQKRQKWQHAEGSSAPNEPQEPLRPNDPHINTDRKKRKKKKKKKEQFIRSFHEKFSLINDFAHTFNGGSSRAYSGEGANRAAPGDPKDEAYGSCSLSSFSITSTSSQSSGPDLSSEDSGESNGTSVPTCEEKPKGGDNSIRASSAELEISAASTSSSSASATLDTSPHASTSSVSSSSYCSNRTDDAPFYGRSQIIKYPSNIYLNSNLAFSYLYSFIIPHEELTFLHLIRSHYEIRTCRGKLARKKRGQGLWQNRGQWQSLPPTNSEPKKPNPMRGDLQNGKVMRSRTFRGKYLGKDVAIKVLVGRVKDFSQIHKIFYKLHLLRHGNIALMMGVSIRYPFVFIIYEFLKNACLFSYLHCAGGYAKDLSGRQREGGVRTPLGSASSISRGGGISAHGSPGNSSTCDSSPGGTSPSDNPTFESHSGRIATRMRNKCNSFVLENDLFCGVYAEEGEEGKEAEEAEQHGGATSGESPPLPANKLNASVKSPPKEWNTHQGKSKAHIEKINKKRGKKKKKLHTKLFLQDQIQLHEPYAFPPFEKELSLYVKKQKKKKKKKILFSYPQTQLHLNLPESPLKEDRRLSVQRILKITTDVTLACSYLEKHLSHPLNLKPTNILLDEALNAKITDFGICEIEKCLDTHVDHSYVVYANGVTTFDAALADRKVHRMEFSRNAFNDVPLSDVPLSDVLRVYDDEDKLHLYSTERIVASPSSAYPSVSFWTPPEILRGQREKPFYADVYALGIVLWEMLTHSVPFNYPFKSHLVASVGYANEELTYDDIPEPIQGLIKSCVHRNMYKRPTFGHILAVLSRLYEKANTKCEDALMSFMDGT